MKNQILPYAILFFAMLLQTSCAEQTKQAVITQATTLCKQYESDAASFMEISSIIKGEGIERVAYSHGKIDVILPAKVTEPASKHLAELMGKLNIEFISADKMSITMLPSMYSSENGFFVSWGYIYFISKEVKIPQPLVQDIASVPFDDTARLVYKKLNERWVLFRQLDALSVRDGIMVFPRK